MPHEAWPQDTGDTQVQWYEAIYELIDMRSFSNLWFWIALAVMWSMVSHWVLGVPYDLVMRARRQGGQAAEDVEALVRINSNRLLLINRIAGLWIVAFVAFMLTTLAMLGFHYDIEFAQAMLCLILPLTIVSYMTVRVAARIRAENLSGAALYRRLTLHRMAVQGVGMVAILVTSLWGMFQNMQIGVL
jgi:hypothetical protein